MFGCGQRVIVGVHDIENKEVDGCVNNVKRMKKKMRHTPKVLCRCFLRCDVSASWCIFQHWLFTERGTSKCMLLKLEPLLGNIVPNNLATPAASAWFPKRRVIQLQTQRNN